MWTYVFVCYTRDWYHTLRWYLESRIIFNWATAQQIFNIISTFHRMQPIQLFCQILQQVNRHSCFTFLPCGWTLHGVQGFFHRHDALGWMLLWTANCKAQRLGCISRMKKFPQLDGMVIPDCMVVLVKQQWNIINACGVGNALHVMAFCYSTVSFASCWKQ